MATGSPAAVLRQRQRLDLANMSFSKTSQDLPPTASTITNPNSKTSRNKHAKTRALFSFLFIIITTFCLVLLSIHLPPVKKHLIFNPLTNLAVRYGYETSDAAKQYLEVTLSEFSEGGCRDVILIFAKGTGEPGNMGVYVGPALADAAKSHFGSDRVAVEGVNYTGLASANFLPGGTAKQGPKEMQRLIVAASSLCPTSTIAVGGYSQGGAVVHRAMESLPQQVRDTVSSVIIFADSRIKQEGFIANYPAERTLQICNAGDQVCYGRLILTLTHLDYARRVSEAVSFIERNARQTLMSPRAS